MTAPPTLHAVTTGSTISCPSCGEAKRLRGEREGDAITITCLACEHRWVRDPGACSACGERTLTPVRVPLVQKARGTQQSIIGYRVVQECTSCGASQARHG